MEADRGGVINAVLFILTILFAWRGFDFYRNNSGQIFFDDLTEGLAATLSAGWSHPAFGICCLVPVLLIIVNLPYIIDRRDNQTND
jgi:hypothetical protein